MIRRRFLGGVFLLAVGFLAGWAWRGQPARPAFAQTPSERAAAVPPRGDGKLRVIAFGAHPDDAELKVGGMAARWAAAGHHVKLVSVTNGDIGHWRSAGGPLALRRKAEVEKAARIL